MTKPESLQPLHPWGSIWWKPQATVKALLHPGRRTYTILLATLTGVGLAIDMARPPLHWFTVIAGSVLLAPVLGLFGLYVYGALLAWTGRPLGGSASQRTLRVALAWAAIPNVVASFILIGALALYRQDFLRAYASTTYTGSYLFDAIIVVTALLSLWSLVLTVRAIGAVQDFNIWRSLANLAAAFAIVMIVWIPVRMFAYQPFVEVSRSMEPTLQMGDFFFAEKWRYGWTRYGSDVQFNSSAPKRGDIIVYETRNDGPEFVKRIIGLPGDEIRVQDGQFVINGTPVTRRPLDDVIAPDGLGSEEVLASFAETLPGGPTITVLDSKTPGMMSNTEAVRVEPGHYFVAGDNRDRSLDSRFPDHGLVPFRNVLGRVGAVYLSVQEPRDTESVSGASGNIRWHRMFRVPQ